MANQGNNTAFDFLSMCHVNCQSLKSHLTEFRHYFTKCDYHIICMSETWLTPQITDEYVCLPDYTLLRCDRPNRGGGGVGIYVHRSLRARLLTDSSESTGGKPEYILAEILIPNRAKLLICVVYRPPRLGYLTEFEDAFVQHNGAYQHAVIFGDFNSDLNTISHDSSHLRNFVEATNLFLVPYGPTHHLRNSSTLLDLCIIDDIEKMHSFGQTGVPFLSAHDLIHVTYKLKVDRLPPREFTCRDFRNFNQEAFLAQLSHLNWRVLYVSNSVDEKVDILNDYLVRCIDTHAPVVHVKPKAVAAPWLTPAIKEMMSARNRARRIWRRIPPRDRILKLAAYENFKHLRNTVQLQIREARSTHYNRVFAGTNSIAATWKELRSLGLVKARKNCIPLAVSTSALNNHFAATGEDDENLAVDHYNLGPYEYRDEKFYFADLSYKAIQDAINSSTSNAIGIDGISIAVIKLALPCIMPVIHHIFSYSLATGTCPRIWNRAIVCPIAKTKTPTCANDYRPVSLLCALSKPFEKIVASQMMHHLTHYHLLDPYQSAFRADHNTQTALLRVLEDVRHACDSREVSILVLFDFSKAFDRVRHWKLIDKLRSLNFSRSSLNWFCSYLSGRQQATRDTHSGVLSDWKSVRNGVPQGSVLGPLLFVLYLTGFNSVLKYCKYSFYADDLQIYLHCKPGSLSDAVKLVNEDITAILNWAEGLGLLLNVSKTKACILGTRRFIADISRNQPPPIIVNGERILYSSEVTCLGVTISSTLSWNVHAVTLSKKINGILYQLKHCRSLLPQNLRVHLISALIFPYLDYCCLVFLDITQEQNSVLTRSLNACIRFALDVRRDEHITPFYRQLKWLKPESRRQYFLGCFTYKLLASRTPNFLANRLNRREQNHDRGTRRPDDWLQPPNCRTELYSHSYTGAAPRLWNSLPAQIRAAPSTQAFKKLLYLYLLDRT